MFVCKVDPIWDRFHSHGALFLPFPISTQPPIPTSPFRHYLHSSVDDSHKPRTISFSPQRKLYLADSQILRTRSINFSSFTPISPSSFTRLMNLLYKQWNKKCWA